MTITSNECPGEVESGRKKVVLLRLGEGGGDSNDEGECEVGRNS